MAKKKTEECEHDFLQIVRCKKCGEEFHTNWMKALVEVKLKAVDDILRRINRTIEMKSRKSKNQEKAFKIAKAALDEVREVYEDTTKRKVGDN